jgi:glycosyltransferase involved in cell wall biosynthesis
MTDDPIRRGVCIYGERTAAAFKGEIIGGAELQMMLLAKALAAGQIPVTLLDPFSPVEEVTCEGVLIKNIPGWNRGIAGLRMITRRIPGLLRLCKESRAGVFYVRGYSFLYVFIILHARLHHALFVLGIASDLDLLGFRARYRSFYKGNATIWDWFSSIIPNHLAAGFVRRFADLVIVQHSDQVKNVQRASVTIGNIVGDDVFAVPCSANRKNIAVVGTLSAQKGLREALPVFRELSEITFEFIGSVDGRDGERIRETIRALPNVIVHGALERGETLSALARANALLNVSPREGFPNTFLEAWAVGTPVVSLSVDPGDVIRNFDLGVACEGDWETLKQVIRDGSYRRDPERLKDYVRRQHSMENARSAFCAAILNAAN